MAAPLPPGRCREHACHAPPKGAMPKKPVKQPCGVCPPCPAPCNAGAPPTEAELEAARLALRLDQTEKSFKRKITEITIQKIRIRLHLQCAMLRVDAQQSKEEAERERATTRDAQARLRELEQRFEGLGEHAHALLRNKEQTLHQDTAVRALKQCYREARDEVDELRALLAEQNVQLQDYRGKHQQAQAAAEEQKKQLAALDMDNTRIAEQINLEVQRIKVKFQERLAELAPLPELLVATQRRLAASQHARALAEHSAAHLSEELETAREKVQMALSVASSKPAAAAAERNDDKLLAVLQARVTQLTELNATLKSEVERQKASALRLEEAVLMCERRLQEKMHECAALGGELDLAREDAGRAVRRADHHADTLRKCMKTTVADMERQLQLTNRQLAVAEKDREATKARMQCQLSRLQAGVERAELRVLALTAQAAAMRADDAGDGQPLEQPECLCQNYFDA